MTIKKNSWLREIPNLIRIGRTGNIENIKAQMNSKLLEDINSAIAFYFDVNANEAISSEDLLCRLELLRMNDFYAICFREDLTQAIENTRRWIKEPEYSNTGTIMESLNDKVFALRQYVD